MRQNIKREVIACILIINLPLSVLSRIPFSYWPRNPLSIYSVRKTNICRRSKASRRANILVLRTSRFQGTTIRPIVRRHKHSIFFIVHHKIFLCVPVQKSYWIIFNFCRWKAWQPNVNDLKKKTVQTSSVNFFFYKPACLQKHILSWTTQYCPPGYFLLTGTMGR